MGKILRRTFLIGSAAIVGGVAFGTWQVSKKYPNPLKDNLGEGQAAITPYVLVDQQGVSIVAPRAEMGQSVRTTLAALVAEELDIALDDVNVIAGPASSAYYNAVLFEEAVPFRVTNESGLANTMRDATHIISKLMGEQVTGGSSSIPDAFEKMRAAGAAARIVLIKAAAKQLKVSAKSLTTDNGAVIAPDGTRLAYTSLAERARSIEPPSKPALKPRSEWKLLGKTQPKVDMVEKCTGTAQYAIDVRLPGMLFATVRTNPHLEAGMKSYDAGTAQTMPGVKKIIPLDNGVAVVASNTWNAFRAAEKLEIEWEGAPYPDTTASMIEGVAGAFDDKPDSQRRKDGDVAAALSADLPDDQKINAEYAVPYLAHSTMEPMNAVAHLHDGQLDVWAGTQSPTRCLEVGKQITGLGADKINIHTTFLGGGFGRRSETDFVQQAIHIAKAMEGTPIKMTWSREEDMCHDVYRPLTLARFSGAVKDGKAHAYDMHVSASSTVLDSFARQGTNVSIADPTIVQNAWDNPYTIENYRVTGYKAPKMLPIGYWRSVGATQNAFFQESATDELAHAANADPLAFRLDLLDHQPSRNVLEAVGEMSNWGSALPAGHGRGIAYYLSFGVPVAEVIEIAQTPAGIKLIGAWAAVDVGIALDPGNIEAQVQSGIIYGLTAAIMGEISVADGKVVETNFHDYPALRMFQTPPIEVRILENMHGIRGIGEPGTPPAAPALANAVFDLTQKRIRTLPLNKSVDFV